MRTFLVTTLVLVLTATSAQAVDGRSPAEDRAPRRIEGDGMLAGLAQRAVLFDRREDALWALGHAYKAGFDRDGACYVPFLGSDAPRNLPVRFRVASLRTAGGEVPFRRDALPVREGTSVLYRRGAFVERYDLGLESLEQSFLVAERVGPGGLTIELDVESELVAEADGDGVIWRGPRGGVRYSGAVAIDARGERVTAPTRLEGGRIAIEVPASALERLRFPLLVDPIVSTFVITPPTVFEGHSPDVAYDVQTGWWAVVYERAFSATDNDVFTVRLDAAGNVLFNSLIDATGASWSTPRIANNRYASQYLIVASVGAEGSRTIAARTQDAFLGVEGPVLTIWSGAGDHVLPDVGGDGSVEPDSGYAVVWERRNSTADSDILTRRVERSGDLPGLPSVLAGPIGTLERAPSISNSNGDGPTSVRRWTVAWQRSTLLDSDVYCARLRPDGLIDTPAFPLVTGAANTFLPCVSSPTRDATHRVLVAYMRGTVGDTDIWGHVLEGSTVVDGGNLTTLTGAPADRNHIYPSVDCDGRDFVLVEAQADAGSTYTVYASTLTLVGDELEVAEGHVSVGWSGPSPALPEVACAGSTGGAPRETLLAWHWQGAGPDPQLFGSLYRMGSFASFCEPGQSGVGACPCGNAPSGAERGCDNSSQTGGARLTPTGSVLPADTVKLTASDMKPSTTCLLVQAGGHGTPVTFGDGLLCVGGTIVRMGAQVASGGTAAWPAPGDPALSVRSAARGDPIAPGETRSYFAYYRDISSTWACAATFNATHAVQVRW